MLMSPSASAAAILALALLVCNCVGANSTLAPTTIDALLNATLTRTPTIAPSPSPTKTPTTLPSASPTISPTSKPTKSASPTKSPTAQPSALPTKSPVDPSVASISATKTSFASNEDVVVTFRNPERIPTWVAIGYPGSDVAGTITDDLSYIMWKYSCGSMDCGDIDTSEGEITFDIGCFLSGTYKAFLLDDDTWDPYKIIASSASFTVSAADNFVAVNKANYVEGEDIRVAFSVPNPMYVHWIVLSEADAAINGYKAINNFLPDNDSYETWASLCGSKYCISTPDKGDFSFSRNLPPGDYQAHLLLNDDGYPYLIGASSEVFSVVPV